MIKTINTDNYSFNEQVSAVVDIKRSGADRAWFTKRAAADHLKSFEGIKPKPGHSLVHVIAMGASDLFGINRNADSFYKSSKQLDLVDKDWKTQLLRNGKSHTKSASTFTETLDKGLKECHPTFVEFGHVFKHHNNKPHNGDKIYGHIKASAYNEPMARVELLIEIPNDEWSEELEKMSQGKDIPWSMACNVKYDVCEYCGHKAKNRGEYCEHAADHLGDLTKEGHAIGVANPDPSFFDISRVMRNADRIAWSIEKVASIKQEEKLEEHFFNHPGFKAALAHDYDINSTSKYEILKKLAEMEKEVPAKGKLLLTCVDDIDKDKLKKIKKKTEKVAAFLSVLSSKGQLLDSDSFISLFTDDPTIHEKISADVRKCLIDGYSNLLENDEWIEVCNNPSYKVDKYVLDNTIHKMASDMYDELSLNEPEVRNRVIKNSINGKETKVNTEKTAGEVHPVAREVAKDYMAYQLEFLSHQVYNKNKSMEKICELTLINNYN